MAVYKDIAGSVLLLPLRGLTIAHSSNSIHFFQLESESSYKITPIQRVNDKGKLITVAYDITASIYIMQNNFEYMLHSDLAYYINKEVECVLVLGETVEYPKSSVLIADINTVNHTKVINASESQDSPLVNAKYFIHTGPSTNIYFEIESVELRPRMIIRLEATVKALNLNRALSDETTTTGNLKVITNTLIT